MHIIFLGCDVIVKDTSCDVKKRLHKIQLYLIKPKVNNRIIKLNKPQIKTVHGHYLEDHNRNFHCLENLSYESQILRYSNKSVFVWPDVFVVTRTQQDMADVFTRLMESLFQVLGAVNALDSQVRDQREHSDSSLRKTECWVMLLFQMLDSQGFSTFYSRHLVYSWYSHSKLYLETLFKE
jgi:hypothetical protein